MHTVNSLGQKLGELRGKTSLYEIEQKTQVPRINLSRYEQGLHLPTEKVLKKLALYFNVTYDELRILYYKDFFAKHPAEREIVLKWAEYERAEASL
jgi:transcriptional regulator with XRE-family HTH domain